MIKVYSIIGDKNNVVLDIPYGQMKIRANFHDGNVFRGIPAKLFTKDPFIIKVLDESELNGKMYRHFDTIKEEGDDEVNTEPKTKKGSQKKNKKENDENIFSDAAEAIAYIAETYNEQVENEAEAIDFLRKQGINCKIGK